MKQKIILIIIVGTLFSCKTDKPANDFFILKGEIRNMNNSELKLSHSNDTYEKLVHVDSNGVFNDSLKLKSGIYSLYYGKSFVADLYLVKGENLVINFDTNDISNSRVFDGSLANEAVYLSVQGEKLNRDINSLETFKLNEQNFELKIDSALVFLNDYLDKHDNISDSFKLKENRHLNYFKSHIKSRYAIFHPQITNNPEFKVSKEFRNSMINEFDYTNEGDYLFSYSYRNLLLDNFIDRTQLLMDKGTLDSYNAIYTLLSEYGQNSIIKDVLLYNDVKYSITVTKDSLDVFYDKFMSTSKNENHKKLITQTYNDLKALSKGQQSPKFNNYRNYAGKLTSLDDLKGNYVYIDLWATWCAPCIKEFPFIKKLYNKYKNKNIEFVSISIDEDKDYENWKTMIKDWKLPNMHLFADKQWNSSFIKDYLIKVIPRFILIDREGNIISSDAPRPSDEKLIELLETIL